VADAHAIAWVEQGKQYGIDTGLKTWEIKPECDNRFQAIQLKIKEKE